MRIEDNREEVIREVERINDEFSKMLHRIAFRIERKVKEKITEFGLVDTGRFRSSVHGRVEGYKVIVQDGVPYGVYHEVGTGLYGPRRDYIRPKRAKYLRFEVKEPQFTKSGRYKGLSRKVVFTKKVRGIEPKRPFLRALEEYGKELEEEIAKVFKDYK